ncbi:DUF2507 domain-containing protein [Furfurilactobacillus entadae]|uniref:DUF2507 domain-containing protein n=1 Tax=Furfurilactobacillus entadae TaxID=2922307 RepID=UPI0038B3BD78
MSKIKAIGEIIMDQATYNKLLTQSAVSALGAGFIRDEVLPTILGDDQLTILYWIGRQVARNNPLADRDAITPLFAQLDFGTLTLTHDSRHQQHFELSGAPVAQRLAAFPKASFDLEAGFLAQQIELITGAATEGTVDEVHKDHVTLLIQTDPHAIVGDVAANVPTLTVTEPNEPTVES